MRKFEPRAELGFVPPGGSTKRCEDCGKDISLAWLSCAVARLHPEERWMLYRDLRADPAVREFRAARRKFIT